MILPSAVGVDDKQEPLYLLWKKASGNHRSYFNITADTYCVNTADFTVK